MPLGPYLSFGINIVARVTGREGRGLKGRRRRKEGEGGEGE